MTDIRQRLAEQWDDDLLFLDPAEQYDACIVGVAERCGMGPVVVYDRAQVVDALVADGMSIDDAEEWLAYNVIGAYVGDRTPMILDRV